MILAAAEILRFSSLESLSKQLWIVQKSLEIRIVCADAGAIFFHMTLPVLKGSWYSSSEFQQTQCHLEEKVWPCTLRYKGNIFIWEEVSWMKPEPVLMQTAVFPPSLSFWVVCVCSWAWHEALLGNSFVTHHKEYLTDVGHFSLYYLLLTSLFRSVVG